MSNRFTGITWDNPRGRNALAASTLHETQALGIDLTWEAHSLEHFEAHPIDDLADRYNLVVMDHPHLGDMIASGGFYALDEVLGSDFVATIEGSFVGPSFGSYRMGGKLWALPLDAATQVMATRADLLESVPETWDEVIRLSEERPVALSLAGPHALLSFLSVCASLGAQLSDGFWVEFPDDSTATEALGIMKRIVRRQSRSTFGMNPISLLDVMVSGDSLACVPLIYGYSQYASAAPRQVTYRNAPRADLEIRGSTIGGAGLALTRKAEPTPELVAYMKWLISRSTQETFIPRHQGQPALTSAWLSPEVNKNVANFYAETYETTAHSQVRPRFAGYTNYQAEASRIIRDGLVGDKDALALVDAFRASFDVGSSHLKGTSR